MNADLSHVFKLGKGPKQVHVNCLIDFTRTIHMDIGSIYMVVKIPEHELKRLKIFDVPPVDNFVKSTRRVYECYFYHMIEMSDLPHV